MSQSRRASAAETAVNTVLGCLINWSVLWLAFGQPLAATGITVLMIGVSSLRLYLVRRAFERFRTTGKTAVPSEPRTPPHSSP